MASDNFVLSVNMNDLSNLSRQLKLHSEKFKNLSNEIKRLYWQLDWETASKGNVYEHIRRASDGASQIYNFLNIAARVSNNIARDLSDADRDIADRLGKEIAQFKRVINSSSISKSHIGRLNASTYNNVKTLGKVKGSSIVPMAYISGNMSCMSNGLSLAFPDIRITGYDWTKLGVSPTFFSQSPSNTVNFYINALVSISASIRVATRTFKTYPFTKYAVSVIEYIDEGVKYFIVTGKYSTLRELGVELPRMLKYGIRAGEGVTRELLDRIVHSDSLKASLNRAKMNVLRSLGVDEADDLFKQVKGNLNKNLRIKAVLSELQDDLLKELPRIAPETLGLKPAFQNALKVALREAANEAKSFANLKTFFTGAGTELKALFSGGGNFFTKLIKSSKALAVIGIVIDIGFDFMQDWDKGWEQLTADVVVDTALGIASTIATTYVASLVAGLVTEMMIGAAIGTCIPIPVVGTIVGAVVGVVVGLAIVLVTEVLMINGKSIKDWAKEGVKWALEGVVDLGGKAIDGVVDFGGKAIDAGGELIEDAGNFLKSGWNSLFGGGGGKKATAIAKPDKANYDNQTTNLQPSSLYTPGSTSITFGSGMYATA